MDLSRLLKPALVSKCVSDLGLTKSACNKLKKADLIRKLSGSSSKRTKKKRSSLKRTKKKRSSLKRTKKKRSSLKRTKKRTSFKKEFERNKQINAYGIKGWWSLEESLGRAACIHCCKKIGYSKQKDREENPQVLRMYIPKGSAHGAITYSYIHLNHFTDWMEKLDPTDKRRINDIFDFKFVFDKYLKNGKITQEEYSDLEKQFKDHFKKMNPIYEKKYEYKFNSGSWKQTGDGISDKQISFLENLVKQKKHDLPIPIEQLSKTEAGKFIGELLAMPNKY
jgi:hypothetical protein